MHPENREFLLKQLDNYWKQRSSNVGYKFSDTFASFGKTLSQGFITDVDLNPSLKKIADTEYNRRDLFIKGLRAKIEAALDEKGNKVVQRFLDKFKDMFKSLPDDDKHLGLVSVIRAVSEVLEGEELKQAPVNQN